jgi:tryptophan-rich sensory protein
MIISILTLAVIGILGAIFWDVQKRKNAPHEANSIEKPTEQSLWIFGIVCTVFFAFLAILWCIYPPEPPFGAKGLPLYIAYLLVGKYGPSLLMFFVGLGFLFFSEKRRRGSQKDRS